MWISDSAIRSRLATGGGQALQVLVTTGLRVSSLSRAFSYVLAQGSSFAMNVPTSGSLIVAVVGSFFAVESSASAYIGLSRCASTSWKSSSAMNCRTVGGLGGGLSMHFSLHTRTALAFMSYDRIRLDSIVYSNVSVLVNGSGFGRELATVMERSLEPPTLVRAFQKVSIASISLEPKKTEFQLDSVTASVVLEGVSRLDDVTISLSPPALVSGSSVPLLYSRCFGCASNASSSIRFVFSDDAVSQVPEFGCGSGVFTPEGSLKLKNFISSVAAFGQWSLLIAAGSSDLVIQSASIDFVLSSLKVSVGSTPVSALVWTSDSSISISVAPGYGQSLNLSATSAMQLSSNMLRFSYLNPVVNALDPAVLSSTAASRLLLLGSLFQVTDFCPRLRIGTACAASAWASDSAIACRLASSRKADVSTTVTLGLTHVSSNTVAAGVTVPAALLASSKSAQLTGGAIIDIYGKAFGAHGISFRVSLAGSSAVATVWLSDSALASKVTLPARVPALFVATVFQAVAGASLYNLSAVVTASCDARNFPATGSYVESIYGANFGMHSASFSAKLGNTAAERFVWVSSTATSCKLSSGSRTWTPSGTGIIASFSQVAGVASVGHASPFASNFSMAANKTVNLHIGAVAGSGFGSNNPSPVVSLDAFSSLKTIWYSDSSMTIALNANQISTDLLLLNFAVFSTNGNLISSSQVFSPFFIPKPAPLITIVSAKVYVPIPDDVLSRMNLFTARGLAFAGDFPSPHNYAIADVGFMEEVTVSAVIYNNGSQAMFSTNLLPISKPIFGTFSVVDAVNLKPVSVACGGADTAFNTTLLANTFAVLVHAKLVFCSSISMRVAIKATFSIPGEFFLSRS
jgi:hypothetical protein